MAAADEVTHEFKKNMLDPNRITAVLERMK